MCVLNFSHTPVNVFVWSVWNFNDDQQLLSDETLKDMSMSDSVVCFLCSLSLLLKSFIRTNWQRIPSTAASDNYLAPLTGNKKVHFVEDMLQKLHPTDNSILTSLFLAGNNRRTCSRICSVCVGYLNIFMITLTNKFRNKWMQSSGHVYWKMMNIVWSSHNHKHKNCDYRWCHHTFLQLW